MILIRVFLAVCLLGSTVTAAPALATTVYRSIGADGSTVFSDIPPEQAALVETLVVETPAAASDALLQDRLSAMRETTDRLVADRQARERHRAELRKLASEQRAAAATATARVNPPEERYYLPYSHRSHRPHRHSSAPRQPLGRRGLPRGLNDYPASLIRRSYEPGVRKIFSRQH